MQQGQNRIIVCNVDGVSPTQGTLISFFGPGYGLIRDTGRLTIILLVFAQDMAVDSFRIARDAVA